MDTKKRTDIKSRMIWPDLLKAFGMVSIIAGHTGVPFICSFVQSFHVPLFFFISGWFYKDRPVSETIRKSAKRNLLPYAFIILFLFIYNMIRTMICFFAFAQEPETLSELVGWSGAFVATPTHPVKIGMFTIYSVGAAWFLPAFFITQTVFCLISHTKIRNILAVLCTASGFGISLFIKLPWHIETALICVAFSCLGKIFREKDLIEKMNLWHWLIITAIWLGGIGRNILFHNWCDYASCTFKLYFIGDILVSLCGILSLIYILKKLEKFGEKGIIRAIAYYGQNTMIVLAFHTIEGSVIDWNQLFVLGYLAGGALAMFLKYSGSVAAVVLVNKTKHLKKIFTG